MITAGKLTIIVISDFQQKKHDLMVKKKQG